MKTETKTTRKLLSLVTPALLAFALLTAFIPSVASGQQVVYIENFSTDPGFTVYYTPVAGEHFEWVPYDTAEYSMGEYYRIRIKEYDGPLSLHSPPVSTR